jgi:hypothetical protein
MDVGEWLRGLGLVRYEEKFRENNIDADVLPQLTADDLKDIGISAVGDRRKLLAAIAVLSGAASSADATVPSTQALWAHISPARGRAPTDHGHVLRSPISSDSPSGLTSTIAPGLRINASRSRLSFQRAV